MCEFDEKRDIIKREKKKAGVILSKFYIIVTCGKDWA